MAGDWLGRGSYDAGSDAEFANFGLADFDRISNEGISSGGYDTDYLGDLLGGQGGSGNKMGMSAMSAQPVGMQNLNIQQAQAQQLPGQNNSGYNQAQTPQMMPTNLQSTGGMNQTQLPNSQNALMGLMNMVGKPQQGQRGGGYQNPYVTSLMQV